MRNPLRVFKGIVWKISEWIQEIASEKSLEVFLNDFRKETLGKFLKKKYLDESVKDSLKHFLNQFTMEFLKWNHGWLILYPWWNFSWIFRENVWINFHRNLWSNFWWNLRKVSANPTGEFLKYFLKDFPKLFLENFLNKYLEKFLKESLCRIHDRGIFEATNVWFLKSFWKNPL